MIVWTSVLLAAALPGTAEMTRQGDLALEMVEGIDRYLARRLATLPAKGTGTREDFRRRIGAVDSRVPNPEPERRKLLGRTASFEVHAVRWPVLVGVDAEGVLIEPTGTAQRNLVLIPDADMTPEDAVRRFGAQRGDRVLIPMLIDRRDTWSGNPEIRMTNQPHREFIYRMAYQAGRHIIGYEVQKVQAAVDWFSRSSPEVPIEVAGYGEGGLIALYSAVLDERISSTTVAGYFGNRRTIGGEPIYRNVWGLLPEYGDGELARLIRPRKLFVGAHSYPEVSGPPPERDRRSGAAPGRLSALPISTVRAEAERAGIPVSETGPAAGPPVALATVGTNARMERQIRQLVEYTQRLVRDGEKSRRKYWAGADPGSAAAWERTRAPYLKRYAEEFIGALPVPPSPLRVETRKIYDAPLYDGYEVYVPVVDEIFAYGVLLIPKGVRPGERRPVVLAQHGLEGRPQELVQPTNPGDARTYQRFAARLAERGFVVFAPQNPYIHGAKFRQLCRKGDPLQLSLYSFIAAQYARVIDWLETLPEVDRNRIGFYGLSYGGTTALRIPQLEPRIKVIVCSGNFNEWSWKITSLEQSFSYMFTREYEIYEFDQVNSFGHAEMVSLMAPRPFFVERGHDDGVGIDEWVAYEFAKVRRLYSKWGMPDRVGIEYFNGIHQIWANDTFSFLHRHLQWP